MDVLVYVGAFLAFVAIYEAMRRRSTEPGSKPPPVQWGWLAAIVGCAVAAVVIGALL